MLTFSKPMMVASAMLLLPDAGLAQERPLAPTALWGSAVVGPGTPYDAGGALTLALRSGRYVFQGRFATVGELFGNTSSDYGLLVGRIFTPMRGSTQLSVSAGVGVVTGSLGGGVFSSSQPADDVMGVLLSGEGRIRLTSFLGISIAILGDFNGRESFGALAGGIYLGQF
jgi:hypothetical protein